MKMLLSIVKETIVDNSKPTGSINCILTVELKLRHLSPAKQACNTNLMFFLKLNDKVYQQIDGRKATAGDWLINCPGDDECTNGVPFPRINLNTNGSQ